MYFGRLGPSWRVIYRAKGQPVVIERSYGKGSVILVGDSYLLSNEALSRELRPDFLAFLLGPDRDGRMTVIFDEAHFGLKNHPGVAGLARRYGLHGLAAGFLLLAGLFIWRQVVRMVPLPEADGNLPDEPSAFSGRDALSGLISMIRRNLPRDRIIEVCVEEWKKSPDGKKSSPEIQSKISAVLASPESRSDPVSAYRAVAEILAEKRKWKKTPPV